MTLILNSLTNTIGDGVKTAWKSFRENPGKAALAVTTIALTALSYSSLPMDFSTRYSVRFFSSIFQGLSIFTFFPYPTPKIAKVPHEAGSVLNTRALETADQKAKRFLEKQSKADLAAQRENAATYITEREQERLETALSTGYICRLKTLLCRDIKPVKTLISNAMALRAIYQDTHISFLHGMRASQVLYLCLLKEIIKAKDPKRDTSRFEFLRIPEKDSCNLEQLKQESLNWTWSIFRFDLASSIRDKLLSCLGNFTDTTPAESPIDFIVQNRNVSSEHEVVLKPCEKALLHYFPTHSKEEIQASLKKLKQLIPKQSKCGSLVLFCVPKSQFDEVAYLSHTNGRVCTCDKGESQEETHQKMQNEDPSRCSWYGCGSQNPQARILINEATRERGCRSFCIRPNEDDYAAMVQGCRAIVSHLSTVSP